MKPIYMACHGRRYAIKAKIKLLCVYVCPQFYVVTPLRAYPYYLQWLSRGPLDPAISLTKACGDEACGLRSAWRPGRIESDMDNSKTGATKRYA